MNKAEDNIKESLFIMGLGHLAQFVIKHNEGFKISGTLRTNKNLDVPSYILSIPDNYKNDQIPKDPDYVLWNYPPVPKYNKVLEYYNRYLSKLSKWVFISSTGVYTSGKVTEKSPRTGETRNAPRLIRLENYLQTLDRPVTVIRPGGLYDEKRHPGFTLAKRDKIHDAHKPVNVINTNDLARFILYVAKNDLFRESYNLVCDDHRSRKEFYGDFMRRNNLPEPDWIPGEAPSKIVCNEKVKFTGFSLKYALQ